MVDRLRCGGEVLHLEDIRSHTNPSQTCGADLRSSPNSSRSEKIKRVRLQHERMRWLHQELIHTLGFVSNTKPEDVLPSSRAELD